MASAKNKAVGIIATAKYTRAPKADEPTLAVQTAKVSKPLLPARNALSLEDLQHHRLRLAGTVLVLFALSLIALGFTQHLQTQAQEQAQTSELTDYLSDGAQGAVQIDQLKLRPLGFELIGTSPDGKIVGYSFAGSTTKAEELVEQADLPTAWMYYVVPQPQGCSIIMQML
jgi:hypothetical protein